MKSFKPMALMDNETQTHYMLEELGESDFESVTVRTEVYDNEELLGEMHLQGWVEHGSLCFRLPEMDAVEFALTTMKIVPVEDPEAVTEAPEPRKPKAQ